jgi:hypothetical protein
VGDIWQICAGTASWVTVDETATMCGFEGFSDEP